MPIRLKPTSQRIRRRRRPKQNTNDSPISAADSFANLEEQNYTRLYNDITNPLEIMKCRHPLETGLKLSDIVNPSNERFNRNILKKICISDSEFEHLCESPNTSSKYRNLFLTPLQKAMTYCMIHDGGSTTDEAILAFILRFWKTISTYNNSDNPGSTNQKYRGPPNKRILHINYTILRDGLPLFVCHGDDRWGTNTIDGIKVKNSNSRTASKESISKIKSFNHLKKDEKDKGDEATSKRGKRRSGQSLSSSGSVSKNSDSNSTKSDIKLPKSTNSDLSRKSSTKISNSKIDNSTKKSGNEDSKSTQSRSQKSNQNDSEGNSSDSDDDKSNLNDQNNSESDSNLSESLEKGTKRGKRSNTSDTSNAKLSRKSSNFSTSASSNPNSKFSSFASLSSSKGRQGRFVKTSFLLPNKSKSNIPEGETFQELLLKTMKNDSRNNNNGMSVSEIAQECQSFKYAPGAYYELPLERRVKSVLFMKKQLKEVDYIEASGSWVALSDKNKDSRKDFYKKIQKTINESSSNNNDELAQNDSETENDDAEEDSFDEKNSYLPEKLRILNMKELTIYDLWNIVNDVGLY